MAVGRPYMVRPQVIYLMDAGGGLVMIPKACILDIRALQPRQEDITMAENAKPAAAPDVDKKIATFEEAVAVETTNIVAVRYWRPVDDPALVSLGGGIVTTTCGMAGEHTTTHLGLTPVDQKGVTVWIGRDMVLDIYFWGPAGVDQAELKRFAAGEPVS